MKAWLVKTLNNTLKPAFDSDYETLKRIKAGEMLEFEIKKPRNIKFHKKFFALLNLIYSNQERYNSLEHLRRDITIEAGFYDVRYNLHGVEVYEPKSISFANMDEHEFGELYSRVLDVAVKFLGADREDIEENIEQYF